MKQVIPILPGLCSYVFVKVVDSFEKVVAGCGL